MAEDTYLYNKTVDGVEENAEHSSLEDHGWIAQKTAWTSGLALIYKTSYLS